MVHIEFVREWSKIAVSGHSLVSIYYVKLAFKLIIRALLNTTMVWSRPKFSFSAHFRPVCVYNTKGALLEAEFYRFQNNTNGYTLVCKLSSFSADDPIIDIFNN